MMTMGSLFDGIGGFPLAAIHNGIIPVWASEIEAFPIQVTKIRFPQMQHVGDITKLDGAKLPPVDIICGGSPCQDLSVAGQRKGLAGERSGLFMEQVRIVKEMRNAEKERAKPNHLVRPRYLVWENVPGAFSSTEGEDFRAVIEEIVRITDSTCHVPRPDTGKWESAGAAILGDWFSLAWRVLDAQYWGVAQRRRRIFLVADFAGRTAPKILFEQDRLLGDFTQSRSSWQGTASTASQSTDITGRTCIETESKAQANLLCLNDQGGDRVCPTITGAAGTSGNNQPVLFDNHGKDCRYNGPLKVAPTVAATYGTGGNNVPLLSQPIAFSLDSKESNSMKSSNPHSGCRETATARTIDTTNPDPSKNQGGIAILQESYCIAGNIIDREVKNGGNGIGCQADISYTLTGMDRHAVFSRQRSDELIENEVASTQSARQHKDATDLVCQPDIFGQSQYGAYAEGCTTLRASGGDHGGGSENLIAMSDKKQPPYRLIRRLTPLECERLQGFPDGWTDIPTASDSARYKALGNSVAIPCVDFVLRGIAYFLRQNNQK